MSLENAREFYKKLEDNPDLRAQVKEATKGVYQIAKDNDLDVAPEELNQVLREKWAVGEPRAAVSARAAGQAEDDTCFSEPPTS